MSSKKDPTASLPELVKMAAMRRAHAKVALKKSHAVVAMEYKDGVLIHANDDPSGPPISGKGTLKFGKHSLEFIKEHFRGTIDDVRIYNYALSQSEIGELFKKGIEK